jgi:hypothetical protein
MFIHIVHAPYFIEDEIRVFLAFGFPDGVLLDLFGSLDQGSRHAGAGFNLKLNPGVFPLSDKRAQVLGLGVAAFADV